MNRRSILIKNIILLFVLLGMAWGLAKQFETDQTVVRMDSDSDPLDSIEEDKAVKKAALTFDDGPHPVYTKLLLDGLKERGVKATFFLIGESIAGQEEVVKRMDQEGHLIGNHTFHHVELNKLDNEDACREIMNTNAAIQKVTGKIPEFIRPPFGAWNKNKNCPVEMIPILWNVDPLDWKTKDADTVVKRVLGKVSDGSIILLHDSYKTSVQAALTIIDTLQKEGYEFVTADQMILD